MVDSFDYDGHPSALSSQAFHDDCADQLQPDGMLVVNLLSHHPQYGLFVDRIRRSFADTLLVVDGADVRNSIVFAFRRPLLPLPRAGVLRKSGHLDEGAARQLPAGFALIVTPLKEVRQ